MDIANEFVVPLDPSQTWKVLLDIKRIAPCVPGAELLDALDDKTYKGKVSVRLGPIALTFVGTAKFEELDEAAKTAKVLAKGSDAKGRGGANSVVQFRLQPVADGTKVIVETNLNLSGSVAQYGRGAGVIQGVASQLTAQFAQNLKAMLAQQEDSEEPVLGAAPATAAPGSGAAEAAAAPEPASVAASPQLTSVSAAGAAALGAVAAVPDPAAIIAALARTEAAAARAEAAAARVEAAIGRVEAAVARAETTATALRNAARPPAGSPVPAKPIAGFSLMLTVLWGMITSMFSSKKNG